MQISALGRTFRVRVLDDLEYGKHQAAEAFGDPDEALDAIKITFEGGQTSVSAVFYQCIRGLTPNTLIRSRSPHLVVGFNEDIVAFDLDAGKLVFRTQIAGPFFEFLQVREELGILAMTELGAVCLSESGRRVWSYEDDTVQDYRLDGDTLHLTYDGTTWIRLNVLDGSVC